MKLEKLQLFGFKSFADKTDFKFKNGVTAIVGPNGSGKSNIVDALRWILGEQSAKSLRGAEMKDVIFNGTAKRKPLGFAEATLAFSHAEDLLGEGNDRLTITRRLYRSGESEYLINGKIARLKDIKDTLAGTGVGFNAYSILEQDKIDKILSANPEERRLVFEEAAGISGYRARRKKTERELERTEQYLARLGDIIGELRSRERGVKVQAGRARRHRELTERLGGMRLDLYMLKFRTHRERMRELETQIEDMQGRADELEGNLRLLDGDLVRKESSLHALSEHLRDLQSGKADTHTEAVAAEQKINYNRQRIEELNNRRESLTADIKSAEEKIEKAIAGRAALQERLHALASQEAAVEEELKAHKLEIYEASVASQELEKRQQELREKGSHALEERSAVRNRLASLDEDLNRYQAACARSSARREEVLKNRERLTASVEEIEKQLGLLGSERSRLERRLQKTRENLHAARANDVRLKRERDMLNVERARRQSRLEALESLIARHSGASRGAQYLLSKKGEPGFKKVRGLLGELIEVDIKNAPMVEAALGRLAQAVVVDTPQTAAKLARHLKEEDRGSAVFVPLSWDSVPYPDCTGRRVVDLIKCGKAYLELIDRLIGDVRISTSLEEAIEDFSRNPGLRFVTSSGELVAPGTVGGGSRDSGGIIHRKSEVAALRKELAWIADKLSEVTAAMEKQEDVCEKLDGECAALSGQIEKISADAGQVEAKRSELLRDCSVAETELRALEAETGDLESLITQTQGRTGELSEKLKAVQTECLAGQEELEANQAELAGARERKESLMEQLAAVQVKLARKREERDSLTRELQAKDGEIRERRQARADLDAQTRSIEEADAAVRKETQKTDRLLDKLLAQIERTQEKIDQSEQNRRELEDEIVGVREGRNKDAGTLREFEGKLSEMRIERQACSTQLEGVIDYARQELGIEMNEEDLRDMVLPDCDHEALEEEVVQTRQRIERLGNVNMEALDELEEITARLRFLTDQEQDLITSKNKLLQVMAKIDRKCRTSLERSFKKIRANFQSVFRKLFGGGRADVYFEEGKDILDAGIEIVARPPGKDLSSLTLLSGGEKAMTTIALLFAIFRSKVSPFCVLDEIDAPLDESNVGKFHQLLREFTHDCRFLIITHNKMSMSAADTLYGITMQEPGVTRRISISFEEAAKHAHETPQPEGETPRQEPAEPALVASGA